MRHSVQIGMICFSVVLAGCTQPSPPPVIAPPAPSPPIVTPEPAPPIAAPSPPVQSTPLAPAPVLRDAVMDATGLPPGPNREVVIAACSNCHDTQVFAVLRHPRAGWAAIINDMIGRGAPVNQANYQQVEDYLATALGPRP